MPRPKTNNEDLQARKTYAFLCKNYRKILGLTQTELAQETGVSRRTIQMIETTKTTPFKKTLLALKIEGLEKSDLPKFDGKVSKEDGSIIDKMIRLAGRF